MPRALHEAATRALISKCYSLNLMVDQYYLWRTGRAVSVALIVVFFEVLLLTVLPAFFNPSYRVPEFSILVGIFFLGMGLLAVWITLGTYSRLCYTLFALVYVTLNKRNEEVNHAV